MNKKRIIVSVTNDLYTDQRVRKVCEFLVAENYIVTLVGRKLKESQDMTETIYKTVRFRLPFRKGALFYAVYNLRLFFYLLFHKADVLLSNDLDTLYANHWARKFKRNCRLIYDSHEYYIGVPELIARPKIQKVWRWIERRTIPKVDEMYTVNESIAEIYRKEYQRVVKVVRNISDFNGLPQPKTRTELDLPEDGYLVIIQGAGINIERGAEELVAAMKYLEEVYLLIVGNGDVLPLLKEIVQKENLTERVLFFGKRPYDELMNFTMVSDLGISMDKDTNINYRFSLPNKIFDYLHAGIPLMVSALKEVQHIVLTYEVGVVMNTHDPKKIAEQIQKLRENPELTNQMRENTKRAAKELTWANECKTLKTIY